MDCGGLRRPLLELCFARSIQVPLNLYSTRSIQVPLELCFTRSIQVPLDLYYTPSIQVPLEPYSTPSIQVPLELYSTPSIQVPPRAIAWINPDVSRHIKYLHYIVYKPLEAHCINHLTSLYTIYIKWKLETRINISNGLMARIYNRKKNGRRL